MEYASENEIAACVHHNYTRVHELYTPVRQKEGRLKSKDVYVLLKYACAEAM